MTRAKELEQAVGRLLIAKKLKFIRVENYRCYRCHAIQNSKAKGWPDYYIYSPIHFAVECKTGRGQLTKEQKAVRDNILKAGDDYLVVRDTVDELIKYLETPRKKKSKEFKVYEWPRNLSDIKSLKVFG